MFSISYIWLTWKLNLWLNLIPVGSFGKNTSEVITVVHHTACHEEAQNFWMSYCEWVALSFLSGLSWWQSHFFISKLQFSPCNSWGWYLGMTAISSSPFILHLIVANVLWRSLLESVISVHWFCMNHFYFLDV